MGLIEQIRKDIQTITADQGGFAVEIVLVAPTEETATVYGLHSKHHLGIDTDGNRVNSKNAHISIAEKHLNDVSYPVRNAAGEVYLKGHLVTVKDSTEEAKQYKIDQWFPNETTGLIICTLGDYE